MAKRRFEIIILLLCLCLGMLPCYGFAASTTDANVPITTDPVCSLTICYGYGEYAFADQSVNLYKVAEVSADFQYATTSVFEAYGLALNGIQTNGEWDAIRSTLDAHILADNITPTSTATTDEVGRVLFSQLTPGLYLASSVEVAQDDLTCFFDSALVALPGLEEDGLWQYQLVVAAKPEVLPPIQPDEEIQLSVLKLWKGDIGRTDRPNRIQVEIFRNAALYKTVTLSSENDWSYRWTAPADGASWNVVERNVPAGYTMTVEQRDTTFVITNTRPDQPNPKPPKTGDTSNILLYTVLLYVSGAILIILGITGKRKQNEKTN